MKIKKHLLIINTINWFLIIITLIIPEMGGVGDKVPVKVFDNLPICTSIDLVLTFGLLIINFLVISNNKMICKNENGLSKNMSIILLILNIISIVLTLILFSFIFCTYLDFLRG